MKQIIEKILSGVEKTQIVLSAKEFLSLMDYFRSEQQKEADESVYLTRKEAAAFLKCDLTTLWRMAKSGKITHHKVGNKAYFQKSELINLVKKGGEK